LLVEIDSKTNSHTLDVLPGVRCIYRLYSVNEDGEQSEESNVVSYTSEKIPQPYEDKSLTLSESLCKVADELTLQLDAYEPRRVTYMYDGMWVDEICTPEDCYSKFNKYCSTEDLLVIAILYKELRVKWVSFKLLSERLDADRQRKKAIPKHYKSFIFMFLWKGLTNGSVVKLFGVDQPFYKLCEDALMCPDTSAMNIYKPLLFPEDTETLLKLVESCS